MKQFNNFIEIKEQIVNYAKRMYDEHLVTATSGNISVRLPEREDAFAITPSSESYLTMTAERIVIMTIDGIIISCPENAKPSSEWKLHAELYRAKPDINAVVHTHSPYATAFAVNHEIIPMILIEMKPWLGGEIPLSEYAPAGTRRVGINVARDIGNKGGCLMANHGVVAIAQNLDLAYVRASYIEDAAKIYHMARSVGKPILIKDNS